MVLPQELQLYAENILRRFPEEFMALGAPGLEDIYDLRPNGTWSRRIMETATEKTVELTLRRWHMPSLVNPQVAMGGMCGMGGYMPQAYAMPGMAHSAAVAAAAAQACAARGMPMNPMAQYPQMPFPNADKQAEDQATQRLSRLENALQALKPQIEAMVTAQGKAQQSQAASLPIPTRASVGAEDEKNNVSPRPNDNTPMTELRQRRHMDKLAIVTSPQTKAQSKQPVQQVQPVQAPQAPQGQGDISSDEPQGKAAVSKALSVGTGEKGRPKVINTVRVAPSDLDPKSPRSPGRYTAWS